MPTYSLPLCIIIITCSTKVPQETHFHLYNLNVKINLDTQSNHYKIMRGYVLAL